MVGALRQPVGIDIEHRHSRASRDQREDKSMPDADRAPGTGDERNLAFKACVSD
jgi:hypothetical protein